MPIQEELELNKIDWEKIKDGSMTILIEIEGQVSLIAMEKEKHEMVTNLAKMSIHSLVRTKKSQAELNDFLDYKSKSKEGKANG